METIQLIIQVLILLGIIYVVFIQERVTKVKDSLWGTIKDYPDIAERRFTWKEEEIKKEAEQKVKEVTAKLESAIKEGAKSLEMTIDWLLDFTRVLALMLIAFGYMDSKNFLVFRFAIKETKHKEARETLYEMLDSAENKIKELIKEH